MSNAALFVLPDGTIEGLYTESIDLSTLGALHIERATNVEFDNIAQCWRVLNRTGQCLYVSSSREECLRFEHEFFTDKENLIRSSD